jgi:integrase
MSRNVKGNAGEADAALRKFMAEIDKGRTKLDNPTLDKVLSAWMSNRRNATPLTRAGDQGYIDKRIVPAIGKIRLDRLKASDLDRAYTRWLDEGLSPATVRKLHAIISSALHQAVKWEWIDRAVSELASPPSTKPTITRFIAPGELAELIQAARDVNPTLAMAISLGAVTGARRGELCALRWSNVDFDTSTLTIRQSLSVLKGPELALGETKTHQIRRLILDGGTIRLLEWWRDQQEDLAKRASVTLDRDAYILTNDPRGRSPLLPNTLSHQFPRLAKSLDPPLPYHFHELRHFAATQMISGGIDPRMAATRLGHARPHITLQIYAHAVAAADSKAAEILGATIPGPPDPVAAIGP